MTHQLQNHIVNKETPIIEAMKKINELPLTLTLFVVDDHNKLIGTLTDGDIRRGLLSGKALEERVQDFMHTQFHYLKEDVDVEIVQEIKAKGVRLIPRISDKGEIVKLYDLHKLKSLLPIDAVIMAGGRGKRLRPITDEIPKPMIQLGNKPILEHNLDQLISFGVENFYISVNYLKEQIIEYFGDGSSKGVNIQYIEEEKPLGTIGALSLAKNIQNEILLMNADLFTNIDFEDFYLAFKNKQADMAIASIPYTVNIPYAIMEGQNGLIEKFKEKPSNTYYANSGIYLIDSCLLDNIPKNQFYNTTDLMYYCLKNNKKLIHNPLTGYWIDIGKHEDLKKAREIIKHI